MPVSIPCDESSSHAHASLREKVMELLAIAGTERRYSGKYATRVVQGSRGRDGFMTLIIMEADLPPRIVGANAGGMDLPAAVSYCDLL
jgi:hypothetical protein